MELLNKEKYKQLLEPVCAVTINNLFVRAVIEQKVTGQVYVDDINKPQTSYIVHPYGMSLLLGNSTNRSFNEPFKIHALNLDAKQDKHEWMQTFPGDWDDVLTELFKGHLIKSAENVTQQDI